MKKWRANSGFTITELIIVVVVIAILASIILVSYAGLSSQALTDGFQNQLRLIRDQVMTYNLQNPKIGYPATLQTAGVTTDNTYTTTYTYSNTSPKKFCVQMSKSGQTYYASDTVQFAKGNCP